MKNNAQQEKMHKPNQLQQMVFAAVLIAVNVVVSRVFIIPVPMTHGYLNLCDAIILAAAVIMGPRWGAAIGGLSGFLLDLLAGYGQYMIFSLIVHGLEGFIAGYARTSNKLIQILILLISALVMVAGYWAVDSILYTPAAGLAGVVPNLFQGLAGVAVALVLLPIARKSLKRNN